MRHTRNTLLLLAAFCLPLATGAQGQPEPLSLDQAIEIGLVNNYQIQIAERDVEIARNNNDWGVAGAYPRVEAGLDVNNSYSRSANPAGFFRNSQTVGSGIIPSVGAVWNLYNGGRVKLTKEQLEDLEERSEGQARIAVENTIELIILAYYNALLRVEQIRVLEEVLNLSRDRIAYEEARREFGQASTFDILQTTDAYLNDSTTYLTQLANYRNAQRTLKLAMGIDDPDRQFLLTDSLIYEPPGFELATLQQQMLANNNQLRNLFTDRELAQVNTRLQESTRLPSIGLGTGISYTYNRTHWGTATFADGNERNLGGIRNTGMNGFLNFSVGYMIYDGSIRRRNIENAKIQEINAQLSIEDFKRSLLAQLENTYVTYLNQRELLQVYVDLLDNARRNLEIAEERFRGGLINSFDYRIIQVNYINASQIRLEGIFNLKQTETELRRLVGELVR